jgi:hypothetical protein
MQKSWCSQVEPTVVAGLYRNNVRYPAKREHVRVFTDNHERVSDTHLLQTDRDEVPVRRFYWTGETEVLVDKVRQIGRPNGVSGMKVHCQRLAHLSP